LPAYDALNRPTSLTAPDSSEIRPTYNEAGLLEKVEARCCRSSFRCRDMEFEIHDARSLPTLIGVNQGGIGTASAFRESSPS